MRTTEHDPPTETRLVALMRTADEPLDTATIAGRLGLQAPANFAEIVRQYIDDCSAAPNAAQTLKGMLK